MSSAGSSDYSLPPGFRTGRSSAVLTGLIMGGVLALGGLVLFYFDPSRHGFYPVCLFHRSTGLLCPGCGSLRALHQLLHGNLAAAVRDNALLVCVLPFLAGLALRCWLTHARKTSVPWGIRPLWLWGGLAVLLVFAVLRNLPGPAFAWLRP